MMKSFSSVAPARRYGHRSITALHVSLVVLGAFFVSVLLIAGSSGGRLFLEENFPVLRGVAYAAWGLGLAAFLAAPILLVRDLGLASSLRLGKLREAVSEAGGRKLFRAFAVGMACNLAVLALSPAGLFLGEDYTWELFRAHLVASTFVVALGSLSALVRLRSVLDELAVVPMPSRVSHAAPAGF